MDPLLPSFECNWKFSFERDDPSLVSVEKFVDQPILIKGCSPFSLIALANDCSLDLVKLLVERKASMDVQLEQPTKLQGKPIFW